MLRLALAKHGGLVTADELIRRLSCRTDQPISLLARWIVEREALAFMHFGQTLLPGFQFDRTGAFLRTEATALLRELLAHLDEWEAMAWLVEPNALLGEASPLEAMESCPADVCHAARACRFATKG